MSGTPLTTREIRVRPAIVELTVSRMKEFLREPEGIFWVFAFPLLLAFALGLAFREKPPDRIPVGVLQGRDAPRLVAALSKSPVLLLRVYSEPAARDALRTGRVSLLVESGASVTYRFDPTRPDARTARLEVDDALQRAAGRVDPVTVHEERVVEKGGRYIDFLIPGLLGMNLMGTGVWGVAFSVVGARMKKLLKRLLATPMRKSEYLLAQALSRLVFLTLEVVALVVFGWMLFGVAVRGSILALAAVCLIGGFSFSGLGLLVASRVRTIEAVSGLANLVLLPMWIVSGVFFSYQRFPDSVQPLIRLLPLTALNDALRAVMTDARPLTAVAWELLVLCLWGGASFAIALKIFRWK